MEAIDRLKRLEYPPHLAQQWLEGNGRCTYCGRDVLHDRLGFACQVGDHLLPQGHYQQFSGDTRNEILCCSLCNSVKGDFDPLFDGEDPGEMLEHHRRTLVQRAREYILQQRLDHWDSLWVATRAAVLGFHFPLP